MSLIDRIDFADLRVFLTIMRTRSFKAAAIELGVTPSAASHAMRRLEQRLAAKLLNRSSRSVSPTVVGLDLARRLEDGFERIGEALGGIDTPGLARYGELRLNVFADAAHLLVAPALPEFSRRCPDVRLTIVVDDRPIDIVAEGYDAGMRYGHHVPEDMVAVPLTGPQRWVVAAAPIYLQQHGTPRTPADLAKHNCLQLLLGDNSRYKWELCALPGDGASVQHFRVPGLITINNTAGTIAATQAGLGLGYMLEARIAAELADGSLQVVLNDYAGPSAPLHMYYSSRRHNHPALRTLVDIIRARHGLAALP